MIRSFLCFKIKLMHQGQSQISRSHLKKKIHYGGSSVSQTQIVIYFFVEIVKVFYSAISSVIMDTKCL